MASEQDIQNMLADLDAKLGRIRNTPTITPSPNYGNSSNVQTGNYQPTGGSAGDNVPLWMKALTGLSSTGKIVTDTLANLTSGQWEDNILTQAWKGQKEAWNDGKFGLGDIPLLGGLYGIGKYGKGFDKTLENFGAAKGGAVSKWGGLAGDILLDPLNYVTLGAGSALKAGTRAAELAAQDLAKGAGLAAGKNASREVPEMLANQYFNKWKDVADIDHYQLDDIAKSIHSDATNTIMNAAKETRNSAQNALFSLDMPFTNRSMQFGQKSDIPLVGKYLQKSDAQIGAQGAAAANDLFRTVGLNPDDPAHAAQISKILAEKFGVRQAEDLTTQGFAHLKEELGKLTGKPEFNPRVDLEQTATALNPTMQYNKFDVQSILNTLRNPRYGADMLEKYGLKGAETSRLADEAPDILEHQAQKLFETSNSTKPSVANRTDDLLSLAKGIKGAENTATIKYNPSAIYKQIESLAKADGMSGERVGNALRKFVQDAGGKSKLGTAASKFNPFNPRTFRSADSLANEAASGFRDTQGKIAGQTRQANEQLTAINTAMKDFTQAEKDAIPYYIENVFPRSFDKSGIDEAKVKQVAEAMKGILKTTGDRGVESGVVKRLRRDYFPHVLKPDVKGFDNTDPDIARILGKSQKAGAGIERTGFDSLAQVDDAIDTLRKEAVADPERYEELMGKAARLQSLYERDPMTAIGNHVQENIRASAMADLFKNMEKDGLLVTNMKDPAFIDRGTHAGEDVGKFHKLTPEEAGAMGLPQGSLVHPDVFEGMKSVNELFTVKGVNNLVDNVNKIVSIWKTLVTSYVPAHYVNNFIGNVANNTMAGVKPASYVEASRLLKGYKAGTLSAADQKIMQQAFDNNVLGGGFSSEFVKSKFATDNVSKADKIVQSITNNGYAKMMRKGGEKIDDFSRMALFVHGLESTGSADKASKLVSKYLFNYNIQNNADRYARTVMPFWNWTKNNLPLQIEGILQQPRFYETYNRVRETFNEDVNAPAGKEYQTTDYLHIPNTKYGAPLRSLPMNDLSRFKENPLDTLRSFMGDLSPALKVLPETTLNKQFFNDKPIYYPNENPAPAIGDYLLNQTGAVDKSVNIIGALKELMNPETSDKGKSDLLQSLGAIFGGKPTVYK